MTPMKILYVVHGFPPRNVAGTETYTYSLAKEIAQNHEVRIFYRFADPKNEEYLIEKGTYEGLDYWAINNTYRKNNTFEAYYIHPVLEPPFRACLEDFRPDLVHFTYLLGGLTARYLHIAKEYNIPVVVTLTDFVLLCCRGQLLDRENRLCEGPRGGLNCVDCLWGESLSFLKKPFPNLLSKILPAEWTAKRINHENLERIRRRLTYLLDTVNKADAIIAPTRFLGETYRKWGVAEEKLIHVGFGINTSFFKGYKPEPSDILRFGFIGQLLPHKGLHVLIDAVKKLNNYRFKVIIYGDNSYKEAAEYLENLLSQSDPEIVEFRGTFPVENISRVYAEIDVLVVPSLWHENSPLVILYGRHTGTPLTVTDLGGMAEFVDHRKTGMVFPAGNSEKLASCLRFFLDHPELTKKMKKNIKPIKTIAENVREISVIYQRLLNPL